MKFVFTLLLKLTKDVGKAALVLVVVTPAKEAFIHDMDHPKYFWLRQEHFQGSVRLEVPVLGPRTTKYGTTTSRSLYYA